MKTNLAYILIAATFTTITINAGEYTLHFGAQNYFMKDIKSTSLPNNKLHESQLKIPDDMWDKIIAYSSPNDRSNIKETCKHLSVLTSINRLDKFIAHDFYIGNRKEKSLLFKALITTSNPDLITTIIQCAKKKAELYNFMLQDAVCITLEKPDFTQEEYIKKAYLHPLLKKAIKLNNAIMIERLKKENINTAIIEDYEENQYFNTLESMLVHSGIITMFLTGMGVLSWGIIAAITEKPRCFYNMTAYCP